MIQHSHPLPCNPARVVVLGSNGFVGSSLARQLNKAGIAQIGFTSRDLDLTQPSCVDTLASVLQPTDAMVFISALSPSRGRDTKTLMRNFAMAQHVTDALEKTPVDHVVYLSSDAVYDDNSALIRAETPCNPNSFHGVMHLTREVMLRTTSQKISRPLMVIRPCPIYGAGDPHNSYGPNRFVRTAKKDGRVTLFGGGEEQRDHIHVDDVAKLIVESLLHRSSGIANAATGSSISFMKLAELIVQTINTSASIECLKRSSPITHRHFDCTDVIRAFPDLQVSKLSPDLLSNI